MDPAVRFSLQYLDALRDCLHLEQEDGRIEFDASRINRLSIERLHSAFDDLDWGTFPRDAIDELGSYGRTHVQTAAVGPAPSLDMVVKLGWLLGERVVLWDNVIRANSFPDREGRLNLLSLGDVALDFVRLREAVALGGVVILPHPSRWSTRFRYYANPLSQIPNVPLAVHGLVNARALLDDGVPLHPYLWAGDEDISSALTALAGGGSSEVSRQVWHRSVQRLITQEQFTFVEDLSPDGFYLAFQRARERHPELYDTIRAQTWPDEDRSIQEEERRWLSLAKAIGKQLAIRDATVREAVVDQRVASMGAVGSVCSAVGGVLGLAPRGAIGDAVLGALAGLFGLAPALLQLFATRWSKPQHGAVYQLFHELSVENKQEYSEGQGLQT